ncbi:MAG: hypothetical protein WD737_06185 [Gemmatimonadota bacterium]
MPLRDRATRADLVAGQGIVANADQGRRRQVTLLEEEVWSTLMGELGADLSTSTRRANLVLRGIRLRDKQGPS